MISNKTRKQEGAVVYFEKIAPYYDSWYATSIGNYVDMTEKKEFFSLFQTKKGLILDLGCGTGNYTGILNAIGLDKSFNMLKIAYKKFPNIPFVCGDALFLPFKDESFDSVISITLFEFLFSPKKALIEIYRVLKPKGEIIIGTLNTFSLWFFFKRLKTIFKKTAYRYARFYTINQLKSLLLQNGFKHISTRGVIYGPPFIPSYLIPIAFNIDRKLAKSFFRHLAAFILVRGEKL